MKMKSSFTAALLLAALSSTTVAHAADSLYAGQEKRALKALSAQEISDYTNGRGMGTSKAAELNHYPGPKHVLDEASKLGLSAEQLATTTTIFQGMQRDATHIGKEIVQKEEELEALYARKQATADNTGRVVNALAALQADFRRVHLNAHLRMREILSTQQIALYDRLRGYDDVRPDRAVHTHH